MKPVPQSRNSNPFLEGEPLVRLPSVLPTSVDSGLLSNEGYVAKLCAFIAKFSKFYDFHAVDFFVDGTFDSVIPESWHGIIQDGSERKDVETIDDSFMEKVIGIASNVPEVVKLLEESWPADLMQFIRTAHSIGLPRDPPELSHFEDCVIDKTMALGMTPKKQLEVQRLAAFIAHVARATGVRHLVDLGAGQGYLSSILALVYGLDVIGVDTDPIQTSGATRRRETLIKRLHRRFPNMGKLVYVNKHITAADTFEGLLRDRETSENANAAQNIEPSSPEEDEKWGLIGLHTCGDLSPITLRMWQQSSATLLINVGCCYNHVSEAVDDDFRDDMMAPGTRDKYLKQRVVNAGRDAGVWDSNGAAITDAANATSCACIDPETVGFPMSATVRECNVHLGWTARMLACQSTCRWTSQGDGAKDAFRRHLYRALLQVAIYDATGVSPVVAVHTAKTRRGALPPFAEYARAAIAALLRDHGRPGGVPAEETSRPEPEWVGPLRLWDPSDQEFTDFYERHVRHGALRKIALVWTLRALMAEAIESLILIDRYLWIAEQTDTAGNNRGIRYDAMLVPLFEHVDSPRNMVIVGSKQAGN